VIAEMISHAQYGGASIALRQENTIQLGIRLEVRTKLRGNPAKSTIPKSSAYDMRPLKSAGVVRIARHNQV
jgi:hypothetical protein